MQKIKTIFDRDWDGNRGVINKYIEDLAAVVNGTPASFLQKECFATEKVDGTNVRLTVRNGILVRLEKRRNPSKVQKKLGIKDPWYVDADEYGPEDKYIWDAARSTDLRYSLDGEWSGEAVGPKIQGNPLNLLHHTVVLFSNETLRQVHLAFRDVPATFDELREWWPQQNSKVGNDCGIEGIVWWYEGAPVYKIKCKDFK
jgi:hypothetical protein